jgi:hypothetical protein
MDALTWWAPDGRGAGWRPAVSQPAEQSVPAGRRWARGVLADLVGGQPRPGVGHEVDLVVTELLSNAIEHGRGRCTARIVRVGAMLRIAVCDRNCSPPTLRGACDADRTRGRGLYLVAMIAHRWGFFWPHPGCKFVWAELTHWKDHRLDPSCGSRDPRRAPGRDPAARCARRPERAVADADDRGRSAPGPSAGGGLGEQGEQDHQRCRRRACL